MPRLSVYDPFAEVFPELFRGLMQPATRSAPEAGGALEIRVDVKEADGSYQVQAEMPGVKKDDIHVQIDGNRVSISAEVKRESEQKEGERVLRSERYYGSVGRSFQLASEIDEGAASAKFEDGVLSLTLPKKQAPAAKRLQIS
ncbi:MAG: Hsp20/alpha crystallin family protein [Burkholderiaceae bacterium]|nr:Hsp20/alpha crystallin family protein [Burkholderiaceae bacterium]